MTELQHALPPEDDDFWGDDGGDLGRPVRAHVLAALRLDPTPYPPPGAALSRLGEPVGRRARSATYDAVTQEHVADLARMARDRALFGAPGDIPVVWSQTHAIARLGELDVTPAVAELIPLFDVESDWILEDLPGVVARAGASALPPLGAYLADHTRWGWGHTAAAAAVEQIADADPALRPQAVELLSAVLADAAHYHEASCTAAMDVLVNLGARESLPLIRHAFELGKIDEMVRGSWGDILEALGVAPEPGDPLLATSALRLSEVNDRLFPPELRALLGDRIAGAAPTPAPSSAGRQQSGRAAEERARKEKQKRKSQSASRKANRKQKRKK